MAIYLLPEMPEMQTSIKNVYEKNLMKRKVFRGVFRTQSSIYHEAFLRK